MEIPKPSDADKDYFRSLVPDDPRVEVKAMFGNLGAFVNGTMFMGLFGPDVGLRLGDADLAELAGVEGTGSFGPSGRPMKGYVSIPRSWRSTPQLAETWTERALEHGASLPPKKKR